MALSPTSRVHLHSPTDIVSARGQARRLAVRLGLTPIECTSIVSAVSELARNILTFAAEGDIYIALIENGRTRGIRIEATDDGPGIPDIALALQDGYSTCGGLGMGLPGTRRLMDEFTIRSAPGQGTRVTAVKWLLPHE